MGYTRLDDELVAKVRNSAAAYDDDLVKLARSESDWGEWQWLHEYHLPEEEGKAASMRQNLVNRWGNSPAITGYRFKTIRDSDNDVEHLAVEYDPRKVVKGAYEEWVEKKRLKTAENNAKKKARAQELKVRAMEFIAGLSREDINDND